MSASKKKRSIGPPMKYGHLLAGLEDDRLYSYSMIAARHIDRTQDRIGYDRVRAAMYAHANRYFFPKDGDRKIKIEGQAEAPAWYGRRWKEDLTPEDLETLPASNPGSRRSNERLSPTADANGRGPGVSMKYGEFIMLVEPFELYSAEAIVNRGKAARLFWNCRDESELDHLSYKVRNALDKFRARHLPAENDGFLKFPGRRPASAWYGYRWLLALPAYYLGLRARRHLEAMVRAWKKGESQVEGPLAEAQDEKGRETYKGPPLRETATKLGNSDWSSTRVESLEIRPPATQLERGWVRGLLPVKAHPARMAGFRRWPLWILAGALVGFGVIIGTTAMLLLLGRDPGINSKGPWPPAVLEHLPSRAPHTGEQQPVTPTHGSLNDILGQLDESSATPDPLADHAEQIQYQQGLRILGEQGAEAGIEFFRRHAEAAGSTLSLFGLAWSYWSAGNPQTAARLCKFILARDPPDNCRAHCNYLLGHLNFLSGNLEEAQTHFARALVIYRKRGDDADISETLAGMAATAIELGDYQMARTRLDEALVVNERSGSNSGFLFELEARLAFAKGDYAAALAQATRSYSAFSEVGDRERAANALCGVGFYQMLNGDWEAGMATSLQVDEIVAENNNVQLAYYNAVNWVLARRCQGHQANRLVGDISNRIATVGDIYLKQQLDFAQQWQCGY